MNQEQYPGPAPIGESGPELIHIPPGASIISAEKMKAALEEKLAYVQEVKHNPLSGLAVGRIVHYVLANGEHRAAIVVRVFEPYGKEAGLANLIVFSDGSNDKGAVSGNVSEQGLFWATSAHYEAEGKTHHTWHWPEKV